MHSIDAAYCYTCCSVVCRSVSMLETSVIHMKMAEPIEVQFSMLTLVAQVTIVGSDVNRQPWKDGGLDRVGVQHIDSQECKELCFRWGPVS